MAQGLRASSVKADSGVGKSPADGVRLHQAMAQGAQDSGAQPESGATGIETLASVQGSSSKREVSMPDSDRGAPVRTRGGIGRSSSAPDHGV